jgi:hypothetical protein
MNSFRNALMLVLIIGVTVLALWQQTRLKSLRAESVALRDQLAQALARPDQATSGPKPDITADQHANGPSSAELLRLRGEVALLRQQLAEVSNNMNKAETDPQSQHSRESELAAAEADLKTREQQAEEAKQRLSAVVAALNLSSDVSERDAEGSLSGRDLESYMSARREAEQAERFVEVARLRIARSGKPQLGVAQ